MNGVDIVGWIGAILVVAAYLLLTMKRVKGDSKTYQAMNLFGAIGVVINSVYYTAYPSAAINIVWVFIAIYGLWKCFSK